MDKNEKYKIYQSNIKMLEKEMQLVKANTQQLIGKLNKEPIINHKNISNIEYALKSSTRLYTFLLCSWQEVRLLKIMHEQSCVAFTELEIRDISDVRSMKNKWRECFNISVCKAYDFHYETDHIYSDQFQTDSQSKKNYICINNYFDIMDSIIKMRNYFAHGEWDIQLNSSKNQILTVSFLQKYDNIQKLDILIQVINNFADIISLYVVYKEKNNQLFDSQIKRSIEEIEIKLKRIDKSNFVKYSKKCYNEKGVR